MARTCYATSRRPSRDWIINEIESFFDWMPKDVVGCIVDWDHSTDYPIETHGREYNQSYCGCDGKRHARGGVPDPECEECHGSGLHNAPHRCPIVCDMVSEQFTYDVPSYRCKACESYDWDAECDCDEVEELIYEQWQEQWAGPVRCCIRAGLDFASSPSAGVIGFTAGDLRRMYPEGVPNWVKSDEKWCPAFCPEHDESECSYFDELPDERAIVM